MSQARGLKRRRRLIRTAQARRPAPSGRLASPMDHLVGPSAPAAPAIARPADHPAARPGRVGALLLNLGTPDASDYRSIRRYLKEFLSDRRVIETSRLIWWPVLNLIILTKRPRPKGQDSAQIWHTERAGARRGSTTPRSGTRNAARGR